MNGGDIRMGEFLDWLSGKRNRELEKSLDEIKKNILDDDQYLFCLNHGLSTNKNDYTESELLEIKERVLQEQVGLKNENRKRLYEVLNREK